MAADVSTIVVGNNQHTIITTRAAAAAAAAAGASTELPSSSPTRTASTRSRTDANTSPRSPKRRSRSLDGRHVRESLGFASPPARPPLHPRNSRMSLFALFSKPRVEKARGYSEQGLDAPFSSSRWRFGGGAASPALSTRGEQTGEEQQRAPSAFSLRRPVSRATVRPPTSHSQAPQRRASVVDAPPLFQAYPQAIKHGVLQVSTPIAESVLQRNRGIDVRLHHESSPRPSADDGFSLSSKRTVRTTLRHVANGSIQHVELPKKAFVLLSSGRVLQYAESGPSDRLPERVLQFGASSAAFACDLIPGRHHVLQISQAVDQHNQTAPPAGSLLSRLGFRAATPKRMPSFFLLVMSDAVEMDAWMTVIREEIEIMGSKQSRTDTPVGPEALVEAEAEEESETAVHRGLRSLRHNASKISLHKSPSRAFSPAMPTSAPPVPPKQSEDDDGKSDTPTIDGIEEEAAQLAEESKAAAEQNLEADVQSVRSSKAPSLEQLRLNSLRSSHRMSRSTVATTASRTNSLTSSPQTDEHSSRDASDSSADSGRPAYRMLSSYGLGRRRSAMPVSRKERMPNSSLEIPRSARYSAALAKVEGDSPVTGRFPPHPTSRSPPRLAVASSEPNLRAAADIKAKHDSKLPSPPPSDNSERPLSVVGDLPSPSAIANDRSFNKRRSLMQVATSAANAQRSSMLRPGKRQSYTPFSLPLRVNPSTPDNRPPTRQEYRDHFNQVDESSGTPVVHTLTAQVDPAAVTAAPRPTAVSRTPSGRLSLFPVQPGMQSPGERAELPKPSRSASATSRNSPPTTSTALRRPTSMQVRSDPAPFLRSKPNSTPDAPLVAHGRVFTPPIRSLKPSRSATALTTRSSLQHPEPFTAPRAAPEVPGISEEGNDRATPLPDRALSPQPPSTSRPPSRNAMSPPPQSSSRPPSRNASGRGKLQTVSSLPQLDLGMPVVGLGPPAPPPSVPLPAPPPGSRPTSPMPVQMPVQRLGIPI